MSNGTHWFGQVASQSVDCGVFEHLEGFHEKVVCMGNNIAKFVDNLEQKPKLQVGSSFL